MRGVRSGVAAVALALLAGCLSPTEPGPSAALAPEALRLLDGPAYDRTIWANDTFPAATTPGTGPSGIDVGPARHFVDLAPLVMEDTPTLIQVRLHVEADNVHIGLAATQQMVARENDTRTSIDAVVVGPRSGLGLIVSSGPQLSDVPYTLEARGRADNGSILPGLPVAVSSSGRLRATGAEAGDPAALLAWSPGDRFEGVVRPDASGTLTLGGASGEYVVMAVGDGPVRLWSHDARPAPLRYLGFKARASPGADAVALDNKTWTVDLPAQGFPLQVGMALASDDPNGVTTDGPRGWAVGPAGTVLSFHDRSLKSGEDWPHWLSRLGDPSFLPGAYRMTFAQDAGGRVHVATLAVSYDRAGDPGALLPPP